MMPVANDASLSLAMRDGREELGLERASESWARAWTIRTPSPLPWTALAAAAAVYLGLDGYDWVRRVRRGVGGGGAGGVGVMRGVKLACASARASPWQCLPLRGD